MQLPGDFPSLSVPAQLLVLSNLERVDRGLAPVIGLSGPLDQDALTGAQNDADPQPTTFNGNTWTANWEGGYASPFEADFVWMYDDGFGSSSIDCTAPGDAGLLGTPPRHLVAVGPAGGHGRRERRGAVRRIADRAVRRRRYPDRSRPVRRAARPHLGGERRHPAVHPLARVADLRAAAVVGDGHGRRVRGEHGDHGLAAGGRRRLVGGTADLHCRRGPDRHADRSLPPRRMRCARQPHSRSTGPTAPRASRWPSRGSGPWTRARPGPRSPRARASPSPGQVVTLTEAGRRAAPSPVASATTSARGTVSSATPRPQHRLRARVRRQRNAERRVGAIRAHRRRRDHCALAHRAVPRPLRAPGAAETPAPGGRRRSSSTRAAIGDDCLGARGPRRPLPAPHPVPGPAGRAAYRVRPPATATHTSGTSTTLRLRTT